MSTGAWFATRGVAEDPARTPTAKAFASGDALASTPPSSQSDTGVAPTDLDMLTYSQTQTKQALEAKLKDPDTAKYRNVAAYHVAGAYAFCGEVNAKNGFGGYTGYERFVGVPNQAFLESEVADFDTLWTKFCDPDQQAPPIWW